MKEPLYFPSDREVKEHVWGPGRGRKMTVVGAVAVIGALGVGGEARALSHHADIRVLLVEQSGIGGDETVRVQLTNTGDAKVNDLLVRLTDLTTDEGVVPSAVGGQCQLSNEYAGPDNERAVAECGILLPGDTVDLTLTYPSVPFPRELRLLFHDKRSNGWDAYRGVSAHGQLTDDAISLG